MMFNRENITNILMSNVIAYGPIMKSWLLKKPSGMDIFHTILMTWVALRPCIIIKPFLMIDYTQIKRNFQNVLKL